MRLAAFIRRDSERIVDGWEVAARALPNARGLSRAALRDHVPELLDAVARCLDAGRARTDVRDLAAVHALARLAEGYDLRQLTAEYGLLRRTILELWIETDPGADPLRDALVLDETIDLAVADAVDSYASARERALTALDRISAAALEDDDDELLPALSAVLRETVPAVETVAILLLDDDGVLRAKAALDLDGDSDPGLTAHVGSGFAGTIAATRQPRQVCVDDRGSPPDELLARYGLRVLYGIPMLRGAELVGVAHIGSRTAAEFSEIDKLLFQTMVHRATALIAHQRAKRELRASEDRFRALVDGVREYAIFMLDPGGHVLTWNAGAERLTGYTAAEVLGRHVAMFSTPEDVASSPPDERLAIAREAGRFEEEALRVRKDGTRFSANVLLTALHDEAGRLRGFANVTRDVTERVRAERAVREVEARAAAIVASALDCIVGMDADGKVTEFNPAAERTFGIARAAALGKEMGSLIIPAALRDRHRTGLARHLATGEAQILGRRLELQALRNDGTEFPVELAIVRLDVSGRPSFTGFLRDITDRKRRDLEVRFLSDASTALAQSLDYEATLGAVARLAIPAIADFCIVDIVDADGALRRVATAHADPRMEEVLRPAQRYAPNVQRPDLFLVRALTTGEAQVAPQVDDAWLARHVAISDEHLAHLRRLGIRSLLTAPLVARGNRLGIVTFVYAASGRSYRPEDVPLAVAIASRAALAIDNARLFADARRATRAREQTLAVVSHDLRSPLGTVTMAANMLLAAAGSDEKGQRTRQTAERILRAGERMGRLIEDLLDVASIDAGRLAVTVAPQEVAAIVEEVFDGFRGAAEERNLRLTRSAPAPLPPVLCDRDRVVQLLSNLVGNAVKLTPSGGSVAIQAERRGSDVVFAVADTGPGIPPDELPRLFDRYWRGRSADYQGTGLGLAITKGIVDAHDGRIWVESRLGEGSTFYVAIAAA